VDFYTKATKSDVFAILSTQIKKKSFVFINLLNCCKNFSINSENLGFSSKSSKNTSNETIHVLKLLDFSNKVDFFRIVLFIKSVKLFKQQVNNCCI